MPQAPRQKLRQKLWPVARVARLMPVKMVRALILRANLLRRAMTLGVRIMVEDEAGRVLLVRHTYVPGWHFPGGGVDIGESAEAAVVRELREETGLICGARPKLAGVYRSLAGAGRDHVVLYRLSAFLGTPAAGTDGEIAEARFFQRDALPAQTSRATAARLAEMEAGGEVSETW